MYIKDIKFEVEFSNHAKKYYCKEFLKKYKSKKWIETIKTIQSTLERAFAFEKTMLIDLLKFSQEEKKNEGLFKLDFRVAGTSFSPKKSGNRVIFHLCNITNKITILLVYPKDKCKKNQSENQWILEHIKNNFKEYKKLC